MVELTGAGEGPAAEPSRGSHFLSNSISTSFGPPYFAPLVSCLVAIAWLVGVLGQPLERTLLTVTYMVAAALPFAAVRGLRRVTGSFVELSLVVALGMLTVGAVSTVGSALGVAPEVAGFAYLAFGMALMVPASRAFERRGAASLAQAIRIDRTRAALLVTGAAGISLYLAIALQSGTGAYPHYFLSSDFSYQLGQIHALIGDNAFPPLSRTYYGGRLVYHYGAEDAAALLARITGLPAHIGAFGILLPVMVGGIWAFAVVMARRLKGAMPLWLTAGILYLSLSHYQMIGFDYRIAGIFIGLLSGHGLTDLIGRQYVLAHFATLGGYIVIAAVALFHILERGRINRIVAVVLAGLAICIKVQAFIVAAGVIGLVACFEAWRARPWNEPAGLRRALAAFIWPAAALGIAAAIYWIEGLGGSGRAVALGFFSDDFVTRHIWKLLVAVACLFVPGLIGLVILRGKLRGYETGFWLVLAFAPLLLLVFTRMVDSTSNENSFDWFQIGYFATPLFGIAAVALMGSASERLGPHARRAVIAVALLAMGGEFLEIPLFAAEVMALPTRFVGGVPNKALYAALSAIPLDGTVIVTNDLVYPGFHKDREYRGTQLGSVRGNQFYFSVPQFDYYFSDHPERMQEQQLLQNLKWSDDILAEAAAHGWTHFLVHKIWPYPQPIPLRQIYDSKDYAVYVFTKPR